MSTHRSRLATWSARIALGLVALIAVIAGLTTYVRATAAPLHPSTQDVPSIARAEPPAEWAEPVARARRQLRTGIVEQNLPGLSVAVGVGGTIVWAEGFGWADVGQRAPVTPDSRFRLGTASTLLTAAAVGRLIEQHRLVLDEDVQAYVPAVAEAHWPVTLRQVMGHVGGVPTDGADAGDGGDDDGPLFRERCERPVEALSHIAKERLRFEPGSQYLPSTHGWILVSAAVEAASDTRFLTLMREQIFQPLAMNGTGAESATEENPEHIGEPGEDAPPITFIRQVILEPLGIVSPAPRPPAPNGTEIATFYVPGRGDAEPAARRGVRAMRPRNLSCYAGARAFFSTPSDLVRFGQALDGGGLLRPATVEALLTSPRLTSGQSTGHGLGWDLRTVTLAGAPARVIVHASTSADGKMVSLLAFRDRGLVVAIASNLSSADTSAMALSVADAFAAKIQQSRAQHPPVR